MMRKLNLVAYVCTVTSSIQISSILAIFNSEWVQIESVRVLQKE